MKGSDPIFENKKRFYIALVFFFIYLIISSHFIYEGYPQNNTFIFSIPLKSWIGLNYVGIIGLIFLFISFYLLVKALNKYKGRMLLLALFLAAITPQVLADTYQKTFATGVYAISYEQENSECEFTMDDLEVDLQVKCELILENHSGDDIELFVEFIGLYSKRDDSMIKLLNNDAPYKIKLQKHQKNYVEIYTTIQSSNLEYSMEGGGMSGMNIIIKSDGVERTL